MNSPEERETKAKARFEILRTGLVALLVAIVLTSLGLSLFQGNALRTVLASQEEERAEQASILKEAVKVLTEAQKDALADHDAAVSVQLRELLRETVDCTTKP